MIVWLVASSPVVGAVVALVLVVIFPAAPVPRGGPAAVARLACARVVMFDALRPPPARSRFASLACCLAPPQGASPRRFAPFAVPALFLARVYCCFGGASRPTRARGLKHTTAPTVTH